MSVIGKKQQGGQQGGTAMGDAFANARQEERQEQPREDRDQDRGMFSFASMGASFRAPMGRTVASEVLTKLHKAMATMLAEGLDRSYEATLIAIPLENTENLSVSLLVLAMSDRKNPKVGVAYHTLILEGSAPDMGTRFENIDGANVEIVQVTSDTYTSHMADVVYGFVERSFPNQPLYSMEACVVPRDFNVEDRVALQSLTANAAFACTTELEVRSPDFTDINLANAKDDSQLTVTPLFYQSQKIDAVGRPFRADFSVEFTAEAVKKNERNGGQRQQTQGPKRKTLLSVVDGFVDLVYYNPDNRGYDPMGERFGETDSRDPDKYRMWIPRIVMTNMEAAKVLTIPAQLLTLLTAQQLCENKYWARAFDASKTNYNESVAMHDIGVLGVEMNTARNPNGIGAPYDTRADNFKPEHFARLINAALYPTAMLSLDIPESTPQTWCNSAFADDAMNNVDATKAIIAGANCLTNGAFSNYWKGGHITEDENNLVHLGYYTRNGVKYDIRDIDYLAILNRAATVGDLGIVRRWTDTFEQIDVDIDVRLAIRREIMMALFSEVTITGKARRVTFTPDFMNALTKGAIDAGLNIKLHTTGIDARGYERASNTLGNRAMMSSESSGLFSRGGGSQRESGRGRNAYYSRY